LLAGKLLKKESFDCIILDINLPGKNGYDVCRDFRIYNKTTPVLMLTAFSELEDKIQGFDSGTDDYLTKPFTTEELIKAIESQLLRSEREASPMVNPVRERLLQVLTEREVEVLACIGKGMVTKSISQALNLSHFTVSAHRGNIMRKLDLHNAAALAALAVQADFT